MGCSSDFGLSDDDFADPLTEEEFNELSKKCYHDGGYRSMDEEGEDIYQKAMRQHQGFGDIPTFHKTYPPFGSVLPKNEPYGSDVQRCAVEAIKHYNTEYDTNYAFVTIVKVNQSASSGALYYITFEAKQIGTPEQFPTTTFEARVLSGIHDYIGVELCRLKASN